MNYHAQAFILNWLEEGGITIDDMVDKLKQMGFTDVTFDQVRTFILGVRKARIRAKKRYPNEPIHVPKMPKQGRAKKEKPNLKQLSFLEEN